MPAKWYQLKVYKQRREVRDASDLRESLDWADVEATRYALKQHILAACERNGDPRREAHLYHLEIRETGSDLRPHGNTTVFALPHGEVV